MRVDGEIETDGEGEGTGTVCPGGEEALGLYTV